MLTVGNSEHKGQNIATLHVRWQVNRPCWSNTWWWGQKGKRGGAKTCQQTCKKEIARPSAWQDSWGGIVMGGIISTIDSTCAWILKWVLSCPVLSIICLIYISSYLFRLRGYLQTIQTGILEGKRKQGIRIHIRRHDVINWCQLIWQ